MCFFTYFISFNFSHDITSFIAQFLIYQLAKFIFVIFIARRHGRNGSKIWMMAMHTQNIALCTVFLMLDETIHFLCRKYSFIPTNAKLRVTAMYISEGVTNWNSGWLLSLTSLNTNSLQTADNWKDVCYTLSPFTHPIPFHSFTASTCPHSTHTPTIIVHLLCFVTSLTLLLLHLGIYVFFAMSECRFFHCSVVEEGLKILFLSMKKYKPLFVQGLLMKKACCANVVHNWDL